MTNTNTASMFKVGNIARTHEFGKAVTILVAEMAWCDRNMDCFTQHGPGLELMLFGRRVVRRAIGPGAGKWVFTTKSMIWLRASDCTLVPR